MAEAGGGGGACERGVCKFILLIAFETHADLDASDSILLASRGRANMMVLVRRNETFWINVLLCASVLRTCRDDDYMKSDIFRSAIQKFASSRTTLEV